MNNPTPKSITQNWNECYFSFTCILYHYSTHTIKSQQLEVVYVIIESSPA